MRGEDQEDLVLSYSRIKNHQRKPSDKWIKQSSMKDRFLLDLIIKDNEIEHNGKNFYKVN